MFEILAIGRQLVKDFRAGDVPAVLRDAGSLLPKLSDLYDMIRNEIPLLTAHPDEAEQTAKLKCDLEECCKPKTAAAAPDPKAIDPATVIMLIQAVVQILGWIHDRRHPKPA